VIEKGVLFMYFIIVFIISYLLGSINTSIIVSKFSSKIDIRKYGSGNAGATNILRTLGKKAALIVVIGDLLKGVIAVIISQNIYPEFGSLIGGIGVILGHNFPLYYNFKGGKGIITSTAVIFMIDWKIGLTLVIISVIVIAITKYVSLGSIVGCILFPISVVMFNMGKEYLIFSLVVTVLALIMHRGNIKRLLTRQESKLGAKIKIK
jgi:glycerol-3-phosphate acyltransferase PlsY